MTAPRPSGRARRIAVAAAGLGVAALAVAPAASADGYNEVAPPQGSQVLPVKHGPTSTQVLGTKSGSDSLAYTGAEVGGVAAGGIVLVLGGALLARAGRRRSAA